jgi:hypothetical protein
MSRGIFHAKVGIFEDFLGGRSSFCGSTNETWSGWADYGNGEAFLAKSTYEGPESVKDVEEMESYFQKLWGDGMPNLNTVPFPDVPKEILLPGRQNIGSMTGTELGLRKLQFIWISKRQLIASAKRPLRKSTEIFSRCMRKLLEKIPINSR